MVALGGGKRVLLVGGEGVVLYAPHGRGMERETSISWEVPNFDQQLAEALSAKNQSKSVVVLFDGTDQTYRREELAAKLSIIDRPKFVKRKLELAFPSYPIRASLEIKPPKKKGRQPKGAKTELPSFLFVALPETEQLDRIGNAMYEAGVPVAGFGLLPLESMGLVNEMSDKVFGGRGKKSRWAVLVGQHETGGLRQVVIKDGNLALTRLTPTSEAGTSGTGWVEEVTRELKATLTYISRFGYSNDDGLDIVVVCGDVEKQFFDTRAIPVTNFQCVNVSEAMRHIGLRSFGMEKSNFADALHAAWASRKTGLKLAVKVPSIQRIMAPRLAARVGSVLLALSILGLMGFTAQGFQEYRSLEEEIAGKQNRKTMLDREYEQEAKIFDTLAVKPDVVKAALSVKKLLETNSVDLRPILHSLKNTLPSDVRIENLNIEHNASSHLKVADASSGAGLFGVPEEVTDPGKVRINLSYSLPDNLILEQKVLRSEDLLKKLKTAFPGFEVSLKKQFGGVERTGSAVDTLGSPAPTPGGGMLDLAEIELRGAPLK
ncbi:MAG: hypothetical protein ACAH80_09615 [Alphaproteobacteria bacterium]